MDKLTQYHARPLTGDEATTSAIGLAAYRKGSPLEWAIADDGADQAATQQLAATGIFTAGSAANESVTVQRTGTCTAIAGTGGVTQGDFVVAEYNTGKLIPLDVSVGTTGDVVYVLGEALKTASADGKFELDLTKAQVVTLGTSLVGAAVAASGSEIDMNDAGATLAAAACLDAVILVDPNSTGASETLTTDTAANLISGGVVTASLQYRCCFIRNTGGEHITLAAGSGVDFTNAGADLVIEDGEIAKLEFLYVGAASVALLITKAN